MSINSLRRAFIKTIREVLDDHISCYDSLQDDYYNVLYELAMDINQIMNHRYKKLVNQTKDNHEIEFYNWTRPYKFEWIDGFYINDDDLFELICCAKELQKYVKYLEDEDDEEE